MFIIPFSFLRSSFIKDTFFDSKLFFKRAKERTIMSDDKFKVFSVPQHVRMSIKELLTCEQSGGSFYRTANKVAFDNVELLGMAKDVKAGEDYAKLKLFSTKQDVSIDVRESGMYRSAGMCDFMNRIPEGSIIIVRGRYSTYEREGEINRDVRPKQIVILTENDAVDLWHALALKSRIQNKHSVIMDDEIYDIAMTMGLVKVNDDEEPGMVRFNYTVERLAVETVVEKPVTRKNITTATMPAEKPKIPEMLKETIAKRVAEKKEAAGTEDVIIDLIAGETGMSKDEINDRVAEIQQEFDMLTRAEILSGIAKDFNIDISAVQKKEQKKEDKTPTIPDKKPTVTKPTAIKPDVKKVVDKKEVDASEKIIDYLNANNGEIDLAVLRSSMKNDGFSAKQIESSIMALFGSRKIDGDEKHIKLVK